MAPIIIVPAIGAFVGITLWQVYRKNQITDQTSHNVTNSSAQYTYGGKDITEGKEKASIEELSSLRGPILIIDVRDPSEVERAKGGVAIENSWNVPLNDEGVPQRDRPTTLNEFLLKLDKHGVALPKDKSFPIITHCGSGGRGGKSAILLEKAGYTNVYNGGNANHIKSALEGAKSPLI